MQDDVNVFKPNLKDLSLDDWKRAMSKLGRQYGLYESLGDKHSALFIDEGETLLVTFETVENIRETYETGEPIGFELVRATGWSHLCLMTEADTWFRDADMYDFFDRLGDDGFFDNFDKVVFYGAGMCGYAASAFSVAAPGCTVVALQPQATLDPQITGWDDRFAKHRRLSFDDRYGYAPDMIDAAGEAFILFDPTHRDEFAQAALFTKDHVTLVRCPHVGQAMEEDLIDMQVLYRILAQAGSGKLSAQSIHKLMRARRSHLPTLRRQLAWMDVQDRPFQTAKLCRAILQDVKMPMARKRLQRLMDNGIELPDPLRGPT